MLMAGNDEQKPPDTGSSSSANNSSAPKNAMSDNYNMAQINQCFKSDRAFHATVSNKADFSGLLANIGKIPYQERGVIAKNIGAVIELNARLLQDTNVFNCIIQILRNVPETASEFQEVAGKIMMKLREALIKNRTALNLYHKPMADYSATIRTFLSLIPAKPKGNFLSSFDEEILNFIMGKASEEQRAQKAQEREARQMQEQKVNPFDDDEEDEAIATDKMQRLIKMMFADVMRLEPDLVSAVILSLVTQLPHGSMVIEDKKIRKDWMQHLDI